jgi:hypothetical protein
MDDFRGSWVRFAPLTATNPDLTNSGVGTSSDTPTANKRRRRAKFCEKRSENALLGAEYVTTLVRYRIFEVQMSPKSGIFCGQSLAGASRGLET